MSKLTNEIVIQRLQSLYGNKYDLSMVNYTGRDNKLTLICPTHGQWSKMAQKIFGYGKSKSMGCPKCNLANIGKERTYNRLKTTEEFIKQAISFHGTIYDYSLVNYVNTDTKIDIICPSHGIFQQLPWGHLKYGCRSCNVHTSKIEKKWLKSLGISALIQQYKIPNLNFTVDGFDPVTNTVYEFYGDYWHGNPKKFVAEKINTRTPKQKTFGQLYKDTITRETILKDAGYKIVSVWESDIR
jgi:G:T-mismatch repair DNA endonuclease (very short patch repair protein)